MHAALEAVCASFDAAKPLPARVYLDPDVFAFDQRRIFGSRWVCVGHAEDLARPGDWLRTPWPRLIVTRGEDLALHALVDVCRHRAATLLDGDRGRATSLVCPYHGWVYEPSGRLRAAPDAKPGFDRAAHGLCRARVDAFAGLVFVTRDDAAPSLADAVRGAPAFLGRADLARLRVGHRACWETAANWKLVVENFQEAHHFPHVHPGLERWTPARASSSFHDDGAGASRGPCSSSSDGDAPTASGSWFGGAMALVDDAETVSSDGRRHERPFIAPVEDRRLVHDAHLFPSLLVSVQPDYALVYRLFPLGVDRTRVDFSILFHPSVVGPSFAAVDVVEHWSRTNAEDRAVCERQQLGLAAGVGPACYTRSEDGVHAFDRLVARLYLSGLEGR
jgi:Rieske 2Fe-2S family protein